MKKSPLMNGIDRLTRMMNNASGIVSNGDSARAARALRIIADEAAGIVHAHEYREFRRLRRGCRAPHWLRALAGLLRAVDERAPISLAAFVPAPGERVTIRLRCHWRAP